MAVGLGLFVVLGLVVLPVLVTMLAVVLVRRLGGDNGAGWDPPESAVRARRHELLIASASALGAVVCAGVVLSLPVTGTGRGALAPGVPGFAQAVGPFAAVVVFCAVRAVGELTWPRPTGTVRTAPLVRRTVRSLGGARLGRLLATALVLVIALVVFGLVAGEGGRQFDHPPVTSPDGWVSESSRGPFPGWPYGGPLLAGLVVALLATIGTLRLIARRSPLAGVPGEHDAAVRATSAARLLGGVQLLTGGTLGITLWIAGHALRPGGELPAGAPGAWLSGVGVVLMVAGVAIGVASGISGLLTAMPRRPAGAQAPAARLTGGVRA
ncbi:hypothetical protein [Myceligenerans pegani]|uniref:Integral membrane protein n=1 Tax=Myceligenerans pegani TaxID=2776917 RepID=A0ABR9MZP4_9MICO|nr:hypothetical protein [Myceligenerans sp. TRM 65318]MBE1876871.1 hypothetical protein [Myceligenerans sp. TRM 65318]MBE3019142.1 hypothetical protein [Myceligenerans sp. TRM 65318]